ncbi:MAG TPA: acyl-CoA dehydrogenase family protein [Candidatus Dormibacteraeota bacterium]|jgi:alkylation response protein AidB-like acyl-CoA dehydrogenase|nr:acyl-CoA dehydrogenase family protein [Candidatus Dormibacteraeota bacterium]
MRRQLTPRQEELAAEVRTFLATEPEVGRHHADQDEQVRGLIEYQRRLHGAGLAVVAWPERFGGRGLAPADAAIVAAEMGRGRAPELVNFVAIDILAPALQRFADEERLLRWLPPMADAGEIWCQLFSEPDAGSDLASLRTRAVADGAGWNVSGEKVWSTWAQYARWGVLLARTGSTESRHKGISAFVVDMRAPGITVSPLRTMTGSAEFCAVHFDGVRLERDALVGEVDGGWAVTLQVLMQERGPYAVRRAAVLRTALDQAIGEARRGRVGSVLRARLVQAVIAMETLDLRIARMVDEMAQGRMPGTDAALTKLLLSRAEQEIFAAWQAMQGASGIAWDDQRHDEIADHYLYSLACSIYGGAREIQHNIIAERMLGLPRA